MFVQAGWSSFGSVICDGVELSCEESLSGIDNSAQWQITELEEDHLAWRSIWDEMQYCSNQKQEV